MAVSRRITAHIDDVTILALVAYISFTMLDTVILFIMHAFNSFQVFIGKDTRNSDKFR